VSGPATGEPRWWTIRRAHSLKPSTYTCPFCGRRLHAMSEHVLIAPEGDLGRRRHAHAQCVRRARESGRLPSRDEWRAAQPRRPRRFLEALRRLLGYRRPQVRPKP
jgi:hypothetical protein